MATLVTAENIRGVYYTGARDVVAPRGRMILELGYDQVESVSRMAERDGWAVAGERQDLQGITRVLTLTPRRRV